MSSTIRKRKDTDLTEVKIEEIQKLNEKVIKLEESNAYIKDRLKELSQFNNQNFDKLFVNIDRIQTDLHTIEKIHHANEMQDRVLMDHEKKMTELSLNLKNLDEKFIKVKDDFKEHATKEKATIRTLGLVFTIFNALISFGSKILLK